MELRDYQQAGIDNIRATLQGGVRRLVVQAATGAGKTKIASAIVQMALQKGKRVAFVVPAISLIDQTVESFYADGITDIGVIQAQHILTDWAKPVQVCSVQTLASKKAYPQADLVIFDECVVAGTKISTPFGDRNIEDLTAGDYVFNAIGVGRVLQTSVQRKPILKIGLSNGQEIKITGNHPVFTGSGWRSSSALEPGEKIFSRKGMSDLWSFFQAKKRYARKSMERADILLSVMREHKAGIMEKRQDIFSGENMQMLRQEFQTVDDGKKDSEREKLEQARVLLSNLFEEIQESYLGGWRSPEIEQYIAENRAQTKDNRRERARIDETATGGFENTWSRMGGGICSADDDGDTFRLSDKLQIGLRECGIADWDRIGRFRARLANSSGEGREEGGIFGDVRVESVSLEERGCVEDVFNLHVSGHPSYYAQGVLVHNCHRLHEAHKEWMGDAEWARVPFIGLSATPWARGLGKYFESLLVIATTQELIDRGYLSPFRVFATGHPDLSGVKTVAGDYHEGELSGAMRAGELTADIVKTWVAKWNKDKTLCFAVDRAHAAHIQERFTAAGIECGYQDALTKDDERREIKRKFHNGEYPVVVNIGTLTTGVDWDVRCIILARPTKSEMLYVQIIGRGLRTAEGKESALILDHSDTTERLGFVTDIHHDELDDGRPKDKAKAKERKTPLPRECKACSCLIPAGAKNCPECGAETKRETGIVERHGELMELKPGMALKKQAKKEMSAEDREQFYYELLGYADEKGYKSGWAGNQYRERFGTWPPNFWGKNPIVPGLTTRSWIKSRQIAWAKSKKRAELHPSP